MLLWTLGRMYLFELVFSLFSDMYPGVELLGHMVVLFLGFWETSIMFSTVAAPIYIPTSSIQGFCFLQILANICGLFDDKHSDRCEVISHCGFNLHFWLTMLSIFSCACWPSACLWKNAYSGLLPIFNQVVCFFDIELYELFIYFGY